MIQLAKDWYQFSFRLGDLCFQPLPKYMTFEITDPIPVPKPGDKPLTVPVQVDRSSNDIANHLYDSAKNVYGIDKHSFWPQFVKDVREVGHPGVIAEVERLAELSTLWHTQCLGELGAEAIYQLSDQPHLGEPLPKKKFDNTKNKVPDGAVGETTWLVPCYKGTPLLSMPEFQDWWKKSFMAFQVSAVPGTEPCVDMIAGGMSVPNKGHRKIRGFPELGSNYPLFSHNENSYRFEWAVDSNLPASAETIVRYTEAGSYLMANNSARFKVKNSAKLSKATKAIAFTVWPTNEGLTHPLIPLACQVIEFVKDPSAWDDIRALPEDDPTLLTLAVFMGVGKARTVLVGRTTVTAAQLRQRLLNLRSYFPSFNSFRNMVNYPEKHPHIPRHLVASLLWSVVTDTEVPYELMMHLKSVPVDWATLRWMALAKKEPMHMATTVLQPPDKATYFPEECSVFLGYKLGRMLYYAIRMRELYHMSQRKSWEKVDPKTTNERGLLAEGMNNPLKALQTALNSREVCAVRLQTDEKRSRIFASIDGEFQRLLEDVQKGVHQNLRQQRLYIALGFNAQRNFEVQVRAHQAACKRAEEEAKKAEEAKKKTEEAKKAEEVPQTTGTNGDENGEEK